MIRGILADAKAGGLRIAEVENANRKHEPLCSAFFAQSEGRHPLKFSQGCDLAEQEKVYLCSCLSIIQSASDDVRTHMSLVRNSHPVQCVPIDSKWGWSWLSHKLSHAICTLKRAYRTN